MSINLIIPYLWNPTINLKKEVKKNWTSLDVIHQKEAQSYLSLKTKTNQEGKIKTVTDFNQLGAITSIMEMEYPDEHQEIILMTSRGQIESKDIKKFNTDGFLMEIVRHAPLKNHRY